jgi:hypothetical protein
MKSDSMIVKLSLCLLSLLWLPLAAQAQKNEGATPIQIRAVLHDPIQPTADLYYTDQKGVVVKLEFRAKDLTRPMLTLPVNGSLVFYDKLNVNPEKPEASLAATCKIPPNTKRGIVVVLPSPAGTKPAYRLVFIDDSAKAFPKGESRILTLLPMEAAIEAGEHKLPIRPGIIANLPPVKKVNEYNMAQTNFYFKNGETWTVCTERQLQYLDDVRRVFIVYVTPGALQPSVCTLIDTAPL